MQSNRPSDQLRYMTIRIFTTQQEDTNWTGAGTGFLFVDANGEQQVPMIVTNKHVLDGALRVGLTFHETKDGNDTPAPGAGRLVALSLRDLPVLRHPNPDVDLAAIALAPIIEHVMRSEGWQPYIKCLDKSLFPSQETIDGMSSLEDIIMVGYPTGLADQVNNFPIVRRGITSTPYAANYQGRSESLADIPVFGGSSGSPIFIVNEGSYATADGIAFGHRFIFVGVLYAGHTETVNGQIVAEPVPTNTGPVAKVTHMINLGICIKSYLISDLAKQIPGW